jgi:hypothetical protein
MDVRTQLFGRVDPVSKRDDGAVEGSPSYDVAIVQFRRFRHPRELRSEGATVADHG